MKIFERQDQRAIFGEIFHETQERTVHQMPFLADIAESGALSSSHQTPELNSALFQRTLDPFRTERPRTRAENINERAERTAFLDLDTGTLDDCCASLPREREEVAEQGCLAGTSVAAERDGPTRDDAHRKVFHQDLSLRLAGHQRA